MGQAHASSEDARQAADDRVIIDHLVQIFPIATAPSDAVEASPEPVAPSEFCEQIRRTDVRNYDPRALLRGD
jgi:hypothetical protein